jgi:hypothetical protein
MGAAAVFETAAEIPPTARCCQYDVLPCRFSSSYRPHCGAPDIAVSCSCCCRQLVEGAYVLRKSTTKPGIPTAIHCQLCNNAEISTLATPDTRCHRAPSLHGRSMGVAMMAAGARRAIASGGGTHTEALVALLSRISVTASCDAELSERV